MQKKLTVTIFTYNRPDTLACLLTSLIPQTFKDWDLFICDDNSAKPVKDDELIVKLITHLDYLGHAIHIHRNDANMGIAKSRNLIVPTINTELIFDCNDDHVLEPDCLERLVECLEDPKVGAAGAATPFVGFFGDKNRWSRRGFKSMKANRLYISDGKLYVTRDVDYFYTDVVTPIEVGHLSQAMYRKALWQPTELDYSVIGFTEETDMTLEFRKKGYKLVFHPRAISWHIQKGSGGIRDKCQCKDNGWIGEIDAQKNSDSNLFFHKWENWIKENPMI